MTDGDSLPPSDSYVVNLFAPEDDILRWIRAETERNELPLINIQPHEGRLLQILMQAVGARKVVEIGALGGYSGVWLARALPADGKLITVEKSSKHAKVARANFEHAGVQKKVEVREGDALQVLHTLDNQGPFDFVFIDANKDSYPQYLAWAVDHLRTGGMVAAHNACRGGRIVDPQDDTDRQMAVFNRALAAEKRLSSTIISMGDGMAVGIRTGA